MSVVNRSGQRPRVLMMGISGVILLVSLIASGALYLKDLSLLFYPAFTVSSASLLYLLKWITPAQTETTLLQRRRLKILRIGVLLGVALLIILSRTRGAERPDAFFGIYFGVVALVLTEALLVPRKFVLFELLLLALSTRVSTFQAAPIIGKDTTVHQGIVGYLITTGELIPTSISYYHWYPVSHLYGGALSLISGISPRISFFIATSGTATATLVLIYQFTTRLSAPSLRSQSGLIAVTIIVLSWPHLNRTAIPIAQTLSLTLVSGVVYLLIIRPSTRSDLLLVGLLFAVGATHVLAPILLGGLLSIYLAYGLMSQQVEPLNNKNAGYSVIESEFLTRRSIPLFSILMIYTLEYFIYTEKLSLQVYRISVLFVGGGSLASAVSDTGNSFLKTEILLSVPPLLLFAGSLLITALFVIVALYDFLERFLLDGVPLEYGTWVFTGGLLFAGFSVAIFVGHGSNITRGLPTAILIVAPVCAIGAVRIRDAAGTKGAATLFVILLMGAYLGIASPTAAIPERTDGFQPMLTNSEIAVVDHINEHDVNSYAHPYIAGKSYVRPLFDGETGNAVRKYSPPVSSGPSYFDSYRRSHPTEPFIYDEPIGTHENVSPPSSFPTVYDSGKARIVRPV